MTSTSSGGSSLITLQFGLDLNIDVAEQEVQAAINAASIFLARDLPNPPIYSKTNPADAPILTLALTSKTLPLSNVEDLADTRLAQKISQLSGVGLVSISGGQKPAVRIQVNPTALSSYGLTLGRLCATASPKRTSIKPKVISTALIKLTPSAPTISCYRAINTDRLIVAYRNGAPVRLSDVADSDRRCREQQARCLDESDAGGHRQHSTPARRQHHRRGRPHKGAPAPAQELVARRGECFHI